MKLQAMVGVAVVAVLTIAVSAAGQGGSRSPLPLPQSALRSHPDRVVSSSGTGSTSGGSAPGGTDLSRHSTNGGTDQPQTYTTAPPAVLTGCTVSVSNSAPLRGQTAETAIVSTTAGAEVRLEADYVKTRSVHDGLADTSGNVSFALAISHAQPGITVPVTAIVSLRGTKYSCSTSFTPVDPVGIFPSAGGGQ